MRLHAQQRDTTLGEVKVSTTRKLFNSIKLNDGAAGQQVKVIDTMLLKRYGMQDMATLLSQQMPVFVKAYSFNGLSTLGLRGASAAQSQVFWNGVPIQNAALGVADISTMPVLFISRANIVYGSSGALFGSGNVGGALMLDNDVPGFDHRYKRLAIATGAGSFGQFSAGLKGAYNTKKWFFSTSAFAQTARNDYGYTTAAGDKAKMPNSTLQSGAAMLQAAYQIKDQNVLQLSAWVQQYDRRIPPALFEPYSAKQQQDRSLRTVASWSRVRSNMLLVTASLINDSYTYTDPAVQLRSQAGVYQYFHEVTWRHWHKKGGSLVLFSPVQVSWLASGADSQRQQRAGIGGTYSRSALKKRMFLSVQARAERVNATNIFLPGAGANYTLVKDLLGLRATVQRTYRMPTLNELYYFPGGNPTLRPEQGWSQDAGYTLNIKRGRTIYYHDVAVFNRNINDWIMWLGGAVWTPHNIASVHSRGVETDNKISYNSGEWGLQLGIATSYVLATTTDSYMPADGSIGQQIPYTPRYNARGSISFSWRKLYLTYGHTYTGYRFITTDESAWLDPYNTGNIQAMYGMKMHKHDVLLNVQCNNVWNARYSVAGFRPMPGINWMAGVRVEL
ncbi:TonB-dependent receptor plug domain-containing protein [Nemorincola caseinilytica]|uniref:TonB-dependent receptor plug domain-containing protein n=1 Tax=Nemorincola caseinilytica TaxID=2054315 RepID=A0ABP8NA23_9BACT